MDGIVLGRIGHYFNAGNGSCAAALIVDVGVGSAVEGTVNLAGWFGSGDDFTRTSVPVNQTPTLEDEHNSFHLAQQCPWGR